MVLVTLSSAESARALVSASIWGRWRAGVTHRHCRPCAKIAGRPLAMKAVVVGDRHTGRDSGRFAHTDRCQRACRAKTDHLDLESLAISTGTCNTLAVGCSQPGG